MQASKQGFPWIDGQFLNQNLSFESPHTEGPPNVHVIIAHDIRDGEIRIKIRRYGSFKDTNEVDIGISKDGCITSFDRYDS